MKPQNDVRIIGLDVNGRKIYSISCELLVSMDETLKSISNQIHSQYRGNRNFEMDW